MNQDNLLFLRQLTATWSSGQTTRYHQHLKQLQNPQSVAEHTFNGLMLLTFLYDNAPPQNLMMAFLLHDAGERWVGDIPYPTKLKLPSVDWDSMEKHELRQRTGIDAAKWDDRLSLPERNVLKVIDLLEGYLYCLHETRAGGKGALCNVRDGYRQALERRIFLSAPGTPGELPEEFMSKVTVLLLASDKLEF